MNRKIGKMLMLVILAISACSHAGGAVKSKSTVVEFPSDLPGAARVQSDAMHLQFTSGGQAILYLEQDHGKTLAILDVTDPAEIRQIGEVAINAPSPYDFAQDLPGSEELIRYRNNSGFAVITFKHYKRPELKDEPDYLHPARAQAQGVNGLLLISSKQSPTSEPPSDYEVLSLSNSSPPTPLATIRGVTERLDRPQTGTTFLLNTTGLTVIRSVSAEQEYYKRRDHPVG